ncbi:MAG TPA: 50S ribosomal protein L17 [Bacteroidales bacterium]|jgi:large subunit ribosomal protein L17|nr:50S ribosomal protein L17 [Bacteroidales bacterium]HOL98496.1 50S ribosomal protein L17 [Bacteroidales bacterium]HOM36140.1 50S ribosomal protein L17 [Bacteroidales bacterium]HPD23456.1 50S ribosomal protein L17 [Bacteroidales bacterium]HRS99588.1 50S ribosomal protein L17 [Bacteroidales bacterium]
MRHNKKVNHLGRTSAHRKAMLSNMASSLILHKRIETTVAKAKALRKYVEPLITRAKVDSTHNRRVVFSYLENKYAVTELFREIAVKVGDRPGGYTRILRTRTRLGDAADMCIIELVDYNENMLGNKDAAKKSKRRSRSKSKKSEIKVAETAVAPETQENQETPKAEIEPSNEIADEKPVEENTSDTEVKE